MTDNGNGKGFTFDDQPAVRGESSLLIGLAGPSFSGKTYSALELATGIQRVVGGDIRVIDTESERSKHYAYDPKTGKGFKFRHVPLTAPFSPNHYRAAIRHCIEKGSKVLVVDSTSHEHEGVGGVLEWQAREVERLMKAWKNATRETVNFAAWNEPKRARRELINDIVTTFKGICCIFCFRAKDKLLPVKGKAPEKVGWMPIAGNEFIYEMTVNLALPPGSRGVPDTRPQSELAKMIYKVPDQFSGLFGGEPLSARHGEVMARWAMGESVTFEPAKQPEPQEDRASTPPPAGPVFRGKRGSALAGKPLADADVDTLVRYRDAVFKARDNADTDERRRYHEDHLEDVNAAIDALRADEEIGDIDDDGEGEPERQGLGV